MKPKESFECVECGKLSIDVYWIHPISGWIIKPESGLPWCAQCYENRIRKAVRNSRLARERKKKEMVDAELWRDGRKKETDSLGDIFVENVESIRRQGL